jgi:hypothetical protein
VVHGSLRELRRRHREHVGEHHHEWAIEQEHEPDEVRVGRMWHGLRRSCSAFDEPRPGKHMSTHRELIIPPAALDDPAATEVARAWVAKGALHCTLDIGVWKDPAAWGLVLADLARHVANAHLEQDGVGAEECVARIRAGFDAEMDAPTDSPSGEFA